MSSVSKSVSIEYLEEGLIRRPRKRSRRLLNEDIQQGKQSTHLAGQIAGMTPTN
jgi:hypothetical protein